MSYKGTASLSTVSLSRHAGDGWRAVVCVRISTLKCPHNQSTVAEDGLLILWKTESGRVLQRIDLKKNGAIVALEWINFLGDEYCVIVGYANGRLRLWSQDSIVAIAI